MPLHRWTGRALGIVAVLIALRGGAESPCASPVYTTFELQMLDLMNAERAAAGAPPLTLHPDLTHVSRRYARYLKENATAILEATSPPNYLTHTSLDGTTAGDRIRGWRYRASQSAENLAARNEAMTTASVAAMHQQWVTSPAHRANMINPRYRDAGIGLYDGPGDPQALVMYGVVNFGERAHGDYGLGEVEILSPRDGEVLPFGEPAVAEWTRTEWVATVWVRVSFDGGMEWTSVAESTAASSVPVPLPTSPTDDMMVWIGSTDPVDAYWYFDAVRCVDVVERPRWIGIERQPSTGAPRLSWTTVPGRRYGVEGRSSTAAPWQALDEMLAGSTEASWADAAAPGAMRIYRISVSGR